MSMTSEGVHSLFSFSTIAKPPTAYSSPPQLTRLTELLSCGKSVNGVHLQEDAHKCNMKQFLCAFNFLKDLFKNELCRPYRMPFLSSKRFFQIPLVSSLQSPCFLTQPRNMHVRLVGDSTLVVDLV